MEFLLSPIKVWNRFIVQSCLQNVNSSGFERVNGFGIRGTRAEIPRRSAAVTRLVSGTRKFCFSREIDPIPRE